MSYTMNTTEELTIRNESAQTAHVVSQIANYLHQLDSLNRISHFHITSAQLIADDDRVDVQDYGRDYDGKLYRSEHTTDGEWKSTYPDSDEPTEYYGLLNFAHNLRIRMPFVEPAKEITFRIDYSCGCSLAFIGIRFWCDLLEALDSEQLRKQVRYVCVEDYDSEERTAFTYRYDESGYGEVPYEPGLNAITDTGNWELDLYTLFHIDDEEVDASIHPVNDEQTMQILQSYIDKYGFSVDVTDATEMALDGYCLCSASELPQVMEDMRQMMRMMYNRERYATLSMEHAVCREFGKLAAIRYSFDVNSNELRVESVRID